MTDSQVREHREFLRQYQIVRASEGWGALDAKYYRSLPRVAPNDPQRRIWQLREQHLDRLLVLIDSTTPMKILDAGAGNGWLSHQLASRGHRLAALDLSDDARDGLGAWRHYPTRFECYQAEFDRLPFQDAEFDLVIFNASLHYCASLSKSLNQARRVTRPNGHIVILDTPFYSSARYGEAMVQARETGFARAFGFKRQVRAIGFLTMEQLQSAVEAEGLSLQVWYADDDWHRRPRRAWDRVRTRRQPARFPIIALKK
jgi:SAM-dependent methyltransferase